jgi:hypothetical protein
MRKGIWSILSSIMATVVWYSISGSDLVTVNP